MTAQRWTIVNLVREHFELNPSVTEARFALKAMQQRLGKDKGNSKYLYELFPYGPAKQACKYAGLPKPTGCV